MARRAKNKGKNAAPPSSSSRIPPFMSSDSTSSTQSSSSSSMQSSSSLSSWPPSLPPSFTPELLMLYSKNIEDLSEDETEERNLILAQHGRLWDTYIDKLEDHVWPNMSSMSEDERTRWTLEILDVREKVSAKEGEAFRNWKNGLSLREKILLNLGPEIDDEGYH